MRFARVVGVTSFLLLHFVLCIHAFPEELHGNLVNSAANVSKGQSCELYRFQLDKSVYTNFEISSLVIVS